MESRAKLEPGSGKHSVYTHFPKDPNCDICLKTKITKASCRKRTGAAVPRPKNFGDLITSHHKVSVKKVNRVTIIDMPWWYKIWAAQWKQSYPCKRKTSQKAQKSLLKFLEPTRKPKVIYTDNSLEFGKSSEGHLQYCCNQVWTKNRGRIPWSGTAFCETFKISCLMGRHLMRGGSANNSKDQ